MNKVTVCDANGNWDGSASVYGKIDLYKPIDQLESWEYDLLSNIFFPEVASNYTQGIYFSDYEELYDSCDDDISIINEDDLLKECDLVLHKPKTFQDYTKIKSQLEFLNQLITHRLDKLKEDDEDKLLELKILLRK